MSLSDRLPPLRRTRGWSQESLASRLGVSRQAVSQWESGLATPELPNLVALADLFAVPLDALVRDPREGCGTVAGTPQEVDDPVVSFLLRAKKATYAGPGAEVDPSRPGSHDLRYTEGPLAYLDTYLGGAAFAGEEALWDEGVPFWAMNYVGRVVGSGFSGDFLKECLALVPADRPFRGPPVHRSGDLLYHCFVEGPFGWFQGREEIYRGDHLVYECRFHGGDVQE